MPSTARGAGLRAPRGSHRGAARGKRRTDRSRALCRTPSWLRSVLARALWRGRPGCRSARWTGSLTRPLGPRPPDVRRPRTWVLRWTLVEFKRASHFDYFFPGLPPPGPCGPAPLRDEPFLPALPDDFFFDGNRDLPIRNRAMFAGWQERRAPSRVGARLRTPKRHLASRTGVYWLRG